MATTHLGDAFVAVETWQDCARRLAAGDFRRVVALTGAGVSTSAGIPDFRGTGVLSSKRWSDCEEELRDAVKNAKPSPTHFMLAELARRGWLRRLYTQNVDGLHEATGMAPASIVSMHGKLDDGSCVKMGDPLPSSFWESVAQDFALDVKCADADRLPPDLVLVLGTSLKVAPACAIPNMARKKTSRWWVTKSPSHRNSFEPGDCCHVGKVRISCRLTFRQRRRDHVFDMDCDRFAEEVIAEWSKQLDPSNGKS